MSPDEERLHAYARDRFGVPPALLDKARRVRVRTGRSYGSVLIEMGVLSPEQVRTLKDHPPISAIVSEVPTQVDQEGSPLPETPHVVSDLRSADLRQLLPVTPPAEGADRLGAPVPPTPWPSSLPGRPEVLEELLDAESPHATRIGDSMAEADAARQLRAAEVARHHARWLPHLAEGARRYAIGTEIARGGMGRIVEATDQVLCRPVAMKLLIGGSEEQLALQARFTEEAQVTGQLEHPNIVPVHDLGISEDGQLYFTMKRVRGRTLRQVLKALRRSDPVMEAAFPLHRLLDNFKQMCMALAYAHSQGVVHRDLKPSNVMFGDFGEVLVMDWGLAKVLARSGARINSLRQDETRWATRHGEVIGTPGYMPPELALGQLDDVDARSDVYSLGALLYEILTLRPPFTGGDSKEILKRQLRVPLVPPRQKAPARDIPPVLEAICMRCLAREMDRRYPSALALHADIDAFLAGSLERARQSETATRFAVEAADHADRWRSHLTEVRALTTEVERLSATLSPAAGAEDHRPLWAAQDALARARESRDAAFLRAEQAYRTALGEAPGHADSKAGLTDLHADGLMAAEQNDAPGRRAYHSERLHQLDAVRHAGLTGTNARLRLQIEPVDAHVALLEVQERDSILVPGAPRTLSRTNGVIEGLTAGRYLMVVRAPEHHAVQVALRLPRGVERRLTVRLRPEGAVARGFVHVPGGRYAVGGDAQALRGLPAQQVELREFCLARLPVTCRQYLEFLNALTAAEPAAARAHAPRLFPSGKSIFVQRTGSWAIPTRAPDGGAWDPNWPIFGISAADAEAWCRWRSGQGGPRLRLPTELEWEIAARGGDGRPFVWGARWLAGLCKSAHARPGPARLEPCGSYSLDRSPCGVMDLAGGVSDWTASSTGPLADGSAWRICRGGNYAHLEQHARAASRHLMDPTAVATWIGFRPAHDL